MNITIYFCLPSFKIVVVEKVRISTKNKHGPYSVFQITLLNNTKL